MSFPAFVCLIVLPQEPGRPAPVPIGEITIDGQVEH